MIYSPNPAYDETLIDNTFLFEIQRQLGYWTPDYQYAELYLNQNGGDVTSDDYMGLYAFVERPERGDGRIEFDRFASDGSSGGWLLEINRMDSISEDGQLPKNFHTAGPDGIQQTPRDLSNSSSLGDDLPRQYNAYINFEHPNPREIVEPQRVAIEKWFQEMEDVLYGRVDDVDWTDPVNGYAKYIDVDNFIDYLMLNNLSHNGDGLLLSMWIYNPDPAGDGKLSFGPMWDADLSSYSGSPTAELMRNSNQLWYGRLMRDPDFVQRYTDLWWEHRASVLSDANLVSVIDQLHDDIGELAVERNGIRNWPSRLAAMKTWLTTRAAAIDRSSPTVPQSTVAAGTVEAGQVLELAAGTNAVYYTLNGEDPRMSGGDPSPNAILFDANTLVTLDHSVELVARSYRSRRWSAPLKLSFEVQPLANDDLNRDGLLDQADLALMCAAVQTHDANFDRNGDQQTDQSDLLVYLQAAFNTSLGDANLDGRFDSSDLVAVFAAGHYDNDEPADWASGDWNCDGRFDSADLVAALTFNVWSE